MATRTNLTTESETKVGTANDSRELPAPTGTPPTVTLQGSNEKPVRQQAVRILLPQNTDKLDKLPKDIDGALVKIVEEVADEAGLAQMEVLMYNGPLGLSIVLHPTPSTVDKRSMQTTLEDFRDQLHSPGVKWTVDACKKYLPKLVGLEVGTLNLKPVGVTDVTTTRLLTKKNQQVTQSGKSGESPLTEIFSTYQLGQIPFIYQVILEKNRGKNKYNASVRMATYRPEHNYQGDKGFAKIVEKGHPLDIAERFRAYKLTSNHMGLADGYWKTKYSQRVDGGVEYAATYDYRYADRYTKKVEVRERADKIKQLVLGKLEHRDLLRGNASYHPVYKERGRYGRFELEPGQLTPFIEFIPIQFFSNPWLTLDGRSHPTFDTRHIIWSIDENVQGVGEGTLYVPDNVSDLANEGALEHQTTEEFTQTWFSEQGDVIKKVKQTGDSVPDGVLLTDDGYIVALDKTVDSSKIPVEVESKNASKPSNTLVNVERAIACDQHVILVYPTATLAKRGYGHVSQTFQGYTDHGAHLYNRSNAVCCPDGRVPVYNSSDKAKWYLEGRRLEARVNDTVIACGDADADVGTFEFGADSEDGALEVYYLNEADDAYRIETADGDVITERTSKDALNSNWTRVYLPHVPLDVSYLHNVTVMYHDKENKELKQYREDHEFDAELDETAGKREWYKAGVETCCDEHIVKQEDSKIPYSDFLDRVGTWFGARSTLGIPHSSETGRALPEYLKDSKKGGTDNKNPYIDGYAWRISRGLKSPHQTEPGDYDLVPPESETGQ